ncbi:MAG: hypothetical protein GY816_01865 [Cytophagales bacterium]|nr:hypothetical protein [Cytophagales bacterium]
MEKTKREEASFILDFKKNREKQYYQFLKNKKLRLRSAVFDLPEFASSPIVSFVFLVNTQNEMKLAEAFIKKQSAKNDVEIALLCSESVELPKLNEDEIIVHRSKLKTANHATSLNQLGVKTSGKIICLLSNFGSLEDDILFGMVNSIKDSDANLVCMHEHQKRFTGIAMASDTFYLARGMDELIQDLEIGLLDLGLRMEMLGCQISANNWPMPKIPLKAEKNSRAGRFTVNQGSDSFTGLG